MKLVASLGTSPGGILETFEYLRRNGVEINDIEVVKTKDNAVSKAYDYLLSMFSCCIKLSYNDVIMGTLELPFSDITTSDDLNEMMKLVEPIINEGDYVDITGGRKAISMVMGLVAMKKKAHVITTIVPQSKYNEVQEKLKKGHQLVTENCSPSDKDFFCSLLTKDAVTIEINLE